MKRILVGIQSFVLFLSTVGVVLAEETKKEGGGYDAVAGVWYALIAIILIYGFYDAFIKPVE